MKLLILSDLHLDMAPMAVEQDGRRIDHEADVVVLAGDIADDAPDGSSLQPVVVPGVWETLAAER